MASDGKKRQKQMARKAAKRKEKKKEMNRRPSGSAALLAVAAKMPILHSWYSDYIKTQGIGSALLSRLLPTGEVAVSLYLVDSYCLGVKDAFVRFLPRTQYDAQYTKISHRDLNSVEASPATVRKLVEDAVAYARSLGIEPQEDYEETSLLFGDIDPNESEETFTFGSDGKPMFVNGPHDDLARCQEIMSILHRTCGEGNYHFLLGGPVGNAIARGEASLFEED